jgi:hypothetical protein
MLFELLTLTRRIRLRKSVADSQFLSDSIYLTIGSCYAFKLPLSVIGKILEPEFN